MTGGIVDTDCAVEVLASYGPFRGFTLHSLAEPVLLDCALCGQVQELTLVATCDCTAACPGCYAHAVARTPNSIAPGRR